MNRNTMVKKLILISMVLMLCMTSIQISAGSADEQNSNMRRVDDQLTRYTHDDLTLIKDVSAQPVAQPLPLTGDTPIFSSTMDVLNPTITANGNDLLVIAEEKQDFSDINLIMSYSEDGGQLWSESYIFTLDDTTTYPVVDYCKTSEFQAYGACLPDPSFNELHFMHFPSMIDPTVTWGDSDGWTIWTVTLESTDYYGIDVAGYPHGDEAPAPEFHGVITLTSEGPSGDRLENFYETSGGSIGACFLDFVGDLGDIVSIDMDATTSTYYEVMELSNDPDVEIEDGVFFEYCHVEAGNENWWEAEWPAFTIEGAHNPDLAADNGDCYIVCELDSGITCYYSNDNGENFDEVILSDAGEYPTVTITGDTVICSYNHEGNVYTMISENDGASWESYPCANDEDGSAVDGIHATDVAGSYVVWTDSRDEYLNVYVDNAGEVAIPIIEIQDIAGGMGVSATVSNTGTGDAADVEWSILFEGGVFVGAETTGTISSLPIGGSEEISSGFILGFGATAITISAGSTQETAEGNCVLFFLLGL